jgi:hypothetical protein
MGGNTLGALDPLEQIRHVNQFLQPGDILVVDGEIHREDSLARRQSKEVQRFACAPLAAIGIGREDGEIRFEQKRDERHSGLYLITRLFHAFRDARTIDAGAEIARGERISMNFQYTYSPEAFRWLAGEHAGLNIREELTSADGRYIAAICTR